MEKKVTEDYPQFCSASLLAYKMQKPSKFRFECARKNENFDNKKYINSNTNSSHVIITVEMKTKRNT